MRGRLVEDDQPRVGEERPGDRESLALAAAQSDAVLADRRVVAHREGRDEGVGAGLARGRPESVVRRVGPGQAEVVGDRAVEQVRSLRDPRDVGAPGREVEGVERQRRRRGSRPASGSMNRSSRLAIVVLPAPVATDQGDDPAATDDEVEAVEGRVVASRVGQARRPRT